MSNKWFKFYGQDYLTDPKMLSLTPAEKALWITLLCLASASSDEGTIKYVSEQKIMALTGIEPLDEEWKKCEGFLKKFEELSMIKTKKEKITVINFTKRQEQQLSNAERQLRYRNKQKSNTKESNASNAIPRHESNARIDKNRIDNNIPPIVPQGDSEDLKKSSRSEELRKKAHTLVGRPI